MKSRDQFGRLAGEITTEGGVAERSVGSVVVGERCCKFACKRLGGRLRLPNSPGKVLKSSSDR